MDDEPLARRGLAALVTSRPGWRVAGEAASGPEALRTLSALEPDVVFLDIRMPGLDGLSVARSLVDLERPPLVVFATAFDDHALEAFEVEAVDYLLKPFDDERFLAAAVRLERRLERRLETRHERRADRPPEAGEVPPRRSAKRPTEPTTTLAVRSVGRVRLVAVDEIQWLAAAGNYVRLYLGDTCLLHRATLTALEATLDADDFVRIHRSTMVRRDQVVELRTPVPGRAHVVLRDGTELEISQRFRQRAFARLVPT